MSAGETKRRRGGGTRPVVWVAQAALLAALLILGARWIDWARVGETVGALGLAPLAAYVCLMLATRAITALRWYTVARGHAGLTGVTFPFLLRTELLAEFANLWLQTFVGGEAVRIWQLARHTGERARAAASVVFDRAIGSAVLVVACGPFLLPLRGSAVAAELPEGSVPVVLGVAGAFALLAAVGFRTLPALRTLAARGLRALRGQRFPAVPLAVGLAVYPVTVLAHWVAFPELASRGWMVTATVALVPRLGRVVPLSLFGLSAVEGSTLLLGAWLGVGAETLVVVAGLNLLVKYLAGGLGAGAELLANGTRFFSEVRRPRPDEAEELAERALDGGPGEPR